MDRLPTELKAHVVEWVSKGQDFGDDNEGPSVVPRSLLSLAECSREFASLAQPYIFEVSLQLVVDGE